MARLALAGLVALLAVLGLPGVASAATHAASVNTITTSPNLGGNNSGFGYYHFNIVSSTPGNTAPFTSGLKDGHCIDATQGAGSSNTLLRTGSDLKLSNPSDPLNTLGTGFTTGAQRLEWILLSSAKYSPMAADPTGVQGAAHQSAIWHLTNPSSPSVINIQGSTANDQAAIARSTQLLADSATYFASVNNAAALSVDGGATLQTCAGTSRTVTVTGSPWTDATLTLSGAGTFHTGGGTSTTVNLGASGSAQVQIDSTGPGAVNVTANVQIATMVQADNGGHQSFVYLQYQTTTENVSLTFKNCQDLKVVPSVTPTFARSFSWSILKSVSGATTQTADAGSTVGFDYTVAVTKSAGVDSGWAASGTINVTNPNAFPVTGTVTDDILNETTDTCTITGGASQTFPAGATTPVAFTCTFSGKPSYAVLTDSASVTWLKDGFGASTVDSGTASLQFGTGSAGNPSVTNDSISVFDAFNGGTPTLLGTTNVSTTYPVHKTIVVPSGTAGCMAVDNTATFTPQNTGNTPGNSSSVTTHVCVTGHDLTITKTVAPSYTRTYTWTIVKTVDGTHNAGPISSDQPSVPAHYSIVTTKTGTNHDYKLAGSVTVTNPNSFPVAGATVADQAPAGFTCTVAGGTLGTLAAGASTTVNYTCTYSGASAPTTGTNHATVTWPAANIPNDASGNTSAGANASYDFSTATVTVEHNAVDVLDTNTNTPLATNVTTGGTYTYDENIPVPNFACMTTPNTATVTDTGKPTSVLATDTATIQLCRTQQGLALSKTAEPSFTRSYGWTITKSVDQTTVTTAADTATFNYTVVATKSGPTDSAWKVTGTITVVNPNAYSVDNVQVSEQGVDNGGTCVLNGTGALGTLVQGQSASVDYTCTYTTAPSSAAGTNTANVTWTLPANGNTPASPQSGTVTKSFVFGSPTTTVHDSVNVGDSFNGAAPVTFGGGTALNASQTFSYAHTVAVPATGCQTYDNTANFTATDDSTYQGNASASVQACRKTPPLPAVVKTSTPPSKTTISLVKRASSPTVKAGGTVGFTIVWKNTGKAKAKNVVICDDLPNQMTFVSAKGASFKNGKACWTRKFVAKGATLTFRVVAHVNANVGTGKLVNVATATASNAKPARATAPVRALRNQRTRAGGVTG